MKVTTETLSYRVPGGAVYKIEYRRIKDTFFGPTRYTMRVLKHPKCRHPLGIPAHLLEANTICVAQGREPRTMDRAKAIALHWISGFEVYRTRGVFPNGQARIDVKEITA